MSVGDFILPGPRWLDLYVILCPLKAFLVGSQKTVLGTLLPCAISLIIPPHEKGLSPFHKPETEALCVS